MALLFLFNAIGLIFITRTHFISSSSPFSSPPYGLKVGSSLSVEKIDDFLISPNGIFTAGFYNVGENAYCFSVWLTKPMSDGSRTIVWMANRDLPVNGKSSKLSLLKTGNLVLRDAYQRLPIWTTTTRDSTQTAVLKMNNSGNLVLQNKDGEIIWQSFDSPSDTLLPNQPLTKFATLVSSRSQTNYSSGFYKLFFDNDNVLRLVYSDSKLTGIYWPNPELRAWENCRSTYGSRRIATLDSSGHFTSTDNLFFNTSDAGDQPLRRLTMDYDGNVRVYSLDESRRIWKVTWLAISETCKIHGSCGENSMCLNDPSYGRKCSCLPNHKRINYTDWSYGCEPEFKPSLCGNGEDHYLHLAHSDFWGYDLVYMPNTTLSACKQECSNRCTCKGFQFKYDWTKGFSICYPKFLLVNGYGSPNFNGSMYLKVPKNIPLSSNNNKAVNDFSLNCSDKPTIQLDRPYDLKRPKESIKFLMLIAKNQGEAELQAEISTLGTLNHMNLIEMWGYCAESKHRFLVYEYMVNGSLAQNLHCSELDWDKRYDIALGTAKGLAYLHEECLEWILHCDIKPQNILLDCDYKPKVADFGLSRLFNRDETHNLEFTKARGTRGYMAPEWLFVNIPITSKVDVFSYGVVMLEMITGRSPTGANQNEGLEVISLHSWVAEKILAAGGTNDWVQEVLYLKVDGNYNMSRMVTLIKVALRCCEEDKDARPTMKQVVDMLLHVEDA
ncbi:Apple-like protein [Artemisia annua]|uniref:Receptor-like serine/threonine-protein kinase n=1 Tax=Artemisia annua TaxID=35608 RepID=A0A2U1MG03_ARTAN|nr:Apple-like protein [Artemisia annua]